MILTAILIAAAAAGGVYWYFRLATYHFAEVDPGALYRDGNRGMREFATAVRKGHIRTVVMLIDDTEVKKEPFVSEVEFCRENNIKLVRIPVTLGKRPSQENVQEFLKVAQDAKNHPILVHCAQGVRRTAMMVAAYQECLMHYSDEQTKERILLWGRRPQALDDVRGFIDDFHPETRTLGSDHVIERPQDKD